MDTLTSLIIIELELTRGHSTRSREREKQRWDNRHQRLDHHALPELSF